MPKRLYYLGSLFFIFLLPSAFLWYFVHERMDLENVLLFVASITLLGSLWDIWATRHGKRDSVWMWSFNPRQTLGIKVFDVPLEEYFFYTTSSSYIILLWEGIQYGRASGSVAMLFALSFAGVWSILAIGIPYILRSPKDKL